MEGFRDLILAEGFRRLSVGEVAVRLRCSRSTLYAIAPTKEDLVVIAVRDYLTVATEDSIARAEATEGALEQIWEFMSAIGEWQRSGSVTFWQDVAASPRVRALVDADQGPANDYVRSCFERGVASGEFRPMHAGLAVRMTWALAAVTQDPELLGRLDVGMDEALEEFHRLMRWGLEKRD